MWVYEYLSMPVLKHPKDITGTDLEENKEKNEQGEKNRERDVAMWRKKERKKSLL